VRVKPCFRLDTYATVNKKCIDRTPFFVSLCIHDVMQELYELGARKLALLDILPVGCLPRQRATTANGDCDADGETLSKMFNLALRAEMASDTVAASMPGLRYSIAGLYNVLSDMIADPSLAGKI
jgi:hypothetical protein